MGNANHRGSIVRTGFSLIELMVAIALGLLVMSALTMVFVNSSQGRAEVERSSRQIENGRYAMQLLIDDLQQAGYYAEFDPRALEVPGGLPVECSAEPGDLRGALRLHVQGYDVAPTNAIETPPTCLKDLRAGTDILVVRRTSSCVAGVAGCDPVIANIPYFQASMCSNSSELLSAVSNWYRLDTDAAAFTLHRKDCTTLAGVHRYRTHIYFIANNDDDVNRDGIPTLKRVELGAHGFNDDAVPLVEGVENLQVEYGLDSAGIADGAPDSFTTDPDSTANWSNVVAAKIYLLVRNTERSPGYSDDKTYALGQDAIRPGETYVAGAAAPCAAAATCYPVGYRRHVYQAEVRLNNPSRRNSTP